MRFTLASATLALATVASATVFKVSVGQNGLEYTPSSVNATAGDQIEFIFYPKNHTVTQSTFANPCQPMANGTDTGFVPVNATNATQPGVFVNINNTDPVWFYCRQASHCQMGMVFAVNPTANKTFQAFQAAANASSGSTSTSGSGSSGSGTAASSAPSSTSSSSGNGKNGAITVGVRAGSLLAAVGFVTGLLL